VARADGRIEGQQPISILPICDLPGKSTWQMFRASGGIGTLRNAAGCFKFKERFIQFILSDNASSSATQHRLPKGGGGGGNNKIECACAEITADNTIQVETG
jgi:hypothetical protein